MKFEDFKVGSIYKDCVTNWDRSGQLYIVFKKGKNTMSIFWLDKFCDIFELDIFAVNNSYCRDKLFCE